MDNDNGVERGQEERRKTHLRQSMRSTHKQSTMVISIDRVASEDIDELLMRRISRVGNVPCRAVRGIAGVSEEREHRRL